MVAIKCEKLTKKFKEATILQDITMEVQESSLYGFLGQDGSGKTTLLKLWTGLLKPTSGSCTLFDKDISEDPAQVLQGVGCLVGEPAFYEHLTAEENLHLFADLLGADAGEVLQSTDITFGSTRINHLTPGMKKQLAIALALLGHPRLLLLDEPLTDLDSATRTRIITLLSAEAEKGTTVFFTTSTPQDIKDLAKEASILKDTTIAAQGPVKTLRQFMEVKK